jgi:UPF0716 protein FxsA
MRFPSGIFILALIFAEIAAFVVVGDAIGVLGTLALTLLGMLAGALLLRWTGVATLMRIRAEVAAGRAPTRALVDGAIGAIAALLLVLPGFITDLLALLLLIPITREAIWHGVRRRFERHGMRRAAFSPRRGGVIELDPRDYSPRVNGPERDKGGNEA